MEYLCLIEKFTIRKKEGKPILILVVIKLLMLKLNLNQFP